MNKPDYVSGSIVNLSSSIIGALGNTPPDNGTLKLLEPSELKAKNIVLLVVDGLGFNYLNHHGVGSPFHDYLKGCITSVFPSTTASAITSIVTGLSPLQYGLTGWFMYLESVRAVTAILPFKIRNETDSSRLSELRNEEIFNFDPLFQKVKCKSFVVTQQRLINSRYSGATMDGARQVAYKNLTDCFDQIRSVLTSDNDRKFVYAYWPEFDSLSHEQGVSSAKVGLHFDELNSKFKIFLESIKGSDTIVIVTADHGFVDTEPEKVITLDQHPELQETLTLPLCGEPRTAYCYVHPEKIQQFKHYVSTAMSECCSMHSNSELVQQGYFGHGKAHPKFMQRIGDYVLIMKDNFVIKDILPGEKSFSQIGVHGGLTEDELLVPLVVARV